MSPKDVANADQSIKLMTDMLPAMWWGLFAKLKEKGFTEQQALELVKTYILSQGTK